MNPEKLLNNKKDLVLGLAVIGLSLYWMFTYSGPYRYLAEFQLRMFGTYVPKLTFLAVTLGLLGVVVGVRFLLRGAERDAQGASQANARSSSAQSAASFRISPSWRLAVLLVPLGLGCYFYFNAMRTRNLQELRAGDFESGRVTSSVLYAEVRGYIDEIYMSKDKYLYIPMREASGSTSPAHILIGVDEKEIQTKLRKQSDGRYITRGMVQSNMDADVKYAFQKNGILIGEPCWVVYTGRDPSSDRKLGLAILGATAVLGALQAAWFACQHKRNLTTQADLQQVKG
jgi:hypothetical protein